MKNNIRKYIQINEIKVSEIIEKTGLAKSYIYDIINSKKVPSILNARKIALAIGSTVDELFPVVDK